MVSQNSDSWGAMMTELSGKGDRNVLYIDRVKVT